MAIYRDNSKRVQPLSSGTSKGAKAANGAPAPQTVEKIVYRPVRRKLPDERHSITHKFSIGGHEGYITVGLYDDGTPGEIFITMAKEGSTISGLMDSFATAISFTLQYGVPLKFLVDKFSHVRFEPSGWTGNPTDPVRQVDHGLHLPLAGREVPGPGVRGERSRRDADAAPDRSRSAAGAAVLSRGDDGGRAACAECGSIMTRNGSCYKCGNCGGTSGCS